MIETTERAGAYVVRCTTEVDMATAGWLADALDTAARAAARAALTVDLREVRFFGSAGVQVLVDLHDQCAARDTRLYVLPSRAVRRTLTLLGLLDEFVPRAGEPTHRAG